MVGEPTAWGVAFMVGFVLIKLVAPLIIVGGGAWYVLTRTDFGRGLTSRAPALGDTGERLLLLESEVGELRRELSEVHERLDFAERMLAHPSLGPQAVGSGEDTPTPPEVAAVK